MNNNKLLWLTIFLLIQTIALHAQPKEMYAVLASIGGYNSDINFPIYPLPGEGWAAEYIKSGLLAQAWDINNIKVDREDGATKASIFADINNMPKNSNTINFFFFGGHGMTDGIYTYNVATSLYTSNIEWITPSELQSCFGGFNTYCAFIEACYSGVFPEQMSTGVICSSSSPFEPSAGSPTGGVGFFTSHLQYGLRFADFLIGSLTAQTLFNYAAPLTTSDALTYQKVTQTPEMRDYYESPLLITIPAYNVILANNFIGLPNQGSIKIDDQSQSMPYTVRKYYGSTVKLEAVWQVINSIEYSFDHWQDGSTINPLTISSLTSDMSFIANFTGKPSNQGRNLYNDAVSGQPITLHWTEHPNSNVTQYQIWRVVKHNGVVGPEQVIATVPRGTTSYVDEEYLVTSTYSYDLIKYDVRPYYAPEGTYSEPSYLTVFGREGLLPKNSNNDQAKEVITEYAISNYPNPFNPTTTINYKLKEGGFVNLKIYNNLGQEISNLVNEIKSAGNYEVQFDASKLPSGIYFYALTVNDYKAVKKMILTK